MSRARTVPHPGAWIWPGVIALLVVLAVRQPVVAQSTEALRLFEEGNTRLEEGNYSGAVGSYLGALDLGVGSAPLYYNLGTAYFRLDQMGQAIRYFERARRLAPDDRLIRHNLEITRSKIRDRFTRLPDPFWERIWQGVVLAIGPTGLFVIGTLAWVILATLVFLTIRASSASPWLRRGMIITTVVAVVFLIGAYVSSAFPAFGTQSVVIEDAVPLFSAAGEDMVMELHEGTVVDILEADGAWMHVRLENGVTGWLEATGLAGI